MYTPHLMLQEENHQSSVIYFIEDGRGSAVVIRPKKVFLLHNQSENESCIYGYASHMNLDIDGSYKLDATK